MSLFLSVFLGMGLLFCGFIAKESWRGIKTHFWEKVECRVLEASIITDGADPEPYTFSARYTYDFAGKTYESEQVALDQGWTSRYLDVQRLAATYTPGTAAVCRVNPEAPHEAVLQHSSSMMIVFMVIPLLFVAIGGGGIAFIWFGKSPEAEADEPLSASSKNTGCGIAFFGLFALAGGGVLAGLFLPAAMGMLLATGWEPTPCVIEKSRLLVSTDSDGSTYKLDILYRYEFGGETYRSNNYNFLSISSGGHSGKRDVLDRYPVGSERTCYVNPADPAQAVLKRTPTTLYWIALIPLLFLLVGIGGMIGMVRKKYAAAAYELDNLPGRRQPLILKPKSSPLHRLIGVTLLALFWNGIVSVFVWQVIQGFQRGRPEWFLVVFLIPFVLIGLCFIAGIAYCLLALLNPRPEVRLTPGILALGETADLQWRFRGNTRRIGDFRLTLEGREEATYRVGTSSRTDTQVFFEQELATTADPGKMARGRLEITIPPDTMHTFKASNNKVIWCLKVHGDIKRWPDVKEEFQFEVVPS